MHLIIGANAPDKLLSISAYCSSLCIGVAGGAVSSSMRKLLERSQGKKPALVMATFEVDSDTWLFNN